MSLYLRAKFEASSIILTSFRMGGGCNFTFPPPQNEPLKSPPRLGLITLKKNEGKLYKGQIHLGEVH